ncbi:MAG: DUF1328 domain-containing protein [Euryarchaeota archaeon]|jgi:uncharacterized membrane protein YtjA (UPF0391 family)|nr:DUF1328 domain-containing protein [Euryarchaeota archaeon]
MSVALSGTLLALTDQLVEQAVFLQGSFIELAILFFILAIVAGVLGAGGIAGMSMRIAKILVVVFLVLAVVSLIF